jgi:hypothetical protein
MVDGQFHKNCAMVDFEAALSKSKGARESSRNYEKLERDFGPTAGPKSYQSTLRQRICTRDAQENLAFQLRTIGNSQFLD